MSKEQVYYEMLTRCDHPVFVKDYSETTDIKSPLNSIYNRLMAKALVRLTDLEEKIRLNLNPDTVTSLMIDDWELNYFGFTKPSLSLEQRKAELLIKFNKQYTMSVTDVISLAQSIVGKTPVITRNVKLNGWVLGQGILGISTTLGGNSSTQGLYLVSFTESVDSNLLKKFDERLTIIEKAGSRHKVKSPIRYWVLGVSTLGIDTTLGG